MPIDSIASSGPTLTVNPQLMSPPPSKTIASAPPNILYTTSLHSKSEEESALGNFFFSLYSSIASCFKDIFHFFKNLFSSDIETEYSPSHHSPILSPIPPPLTPTVYPVNSPLPPLELKRSAHPAVTNPPPLSLAPQQSSAPPRPQDIQENHDSLVQDLMHSEEISLDTLTKKINDLIAAVPPSNGAGHDAVKKFAEAVDNLKNSFSKLLTYYAQEGTLKKALGDGNCFYYAVVQSCDWGMNDKEALKKVLKEYNSSLEWKDEYSTWARARLLRLKAVDTMQTQLEQDLNSHLVDGLSLPDSAKIALSPDKKLKIQQFCNYHRRNSSYVDHYLLGHVADVIQQPLYICQTTPSGSRSLKYVFKEQHDTTPVTLLHNGNHYDSLINLKEQPRLVPSLLAETLAVGEALFPVA